MKENATPSTQTSTFREGPHYASLRHRLVSLFYESLLLAALLLVAGFAYVPVFGSIHGPFQKAVFQLYLLGVMLVYFVMFWKRGGQTLAMKTWHIRLTSAEGGPLSTPLCILRFALALVGLLCAGLGFLWAMVDRDRQFLHDRIAGTRLIRTD
jgi:uncharacterized RDD family membrane protein YckC